MTIEEAIKIPYIVSLLAEGWTAKELRTAVLKVPLTTELRAALGRQLAKDNDALVAARQNKLNTQNTLNREKKARAGAVDNVCKRLTEGLDELGHPLGVEAQAEYASKAAALRAEYDEFEAQRKQTLADLRADLETLEEGQQKIAAQIAEGKGSATLEVVDMVDFGSGLVRTVRVDLGEPIGADRKLDEHERQLGLFGARVKEIPMTSAEWTLAISGRLIDAAASYAVRIGVSEAVARKAIRAMVPSDELPPEVEDDLEGSDDEGLDQPEPPEKEAPPVTSDRKLAPTPFTSRTYTIHVVGYDAKMATKLAKKLADVMGQKLAVAKGVLVEVDAYMANGKLEPWQAPKVAVHVEERYVGPAQLYLKNAGAETFAVAEEDEQKEPVKVAQGDLWPATRIGRDAAAGDA